MNRPNVIYLSLTAEWIEKHEDGEFTYISCGSVDSSVLEYRNNDPPLSTLRAFREVRSVYSFVIAKRSTHTPAWTALAACDMPIRYILKYSCRILTNLYTELPDFCRSLSAPEGIYDQHPLLYRHFVPHLYPVGQPHNLVDQIKTQIS